MTDADSTRSQTQPSVTAEGEAFPSDPRRLRYLPGPAPGRGSVVEAAPGVLWARIPLPIDLNHINVWLLDAGDGCVIVDSGISISMAREAWEAIAARVFVDKPLRGVFITHIHPDHIGLAAWLQQRFGAPVSMSSRTFEVARGVLEPATPASVAEARDFLRRHGLREVEQVLPLFSPERFAQITSGLPAVDQFVADGQTLPWAPAWTAMQTDGHAEGHLCLSNGALRLLVSGDQVLPTISSNVSLTFRSSDPDPLGSYLDSLRRLRLLHPETLVLPSHGLPFFGLQQRIDDLLGHHEEQLARVLTLCAQPKAAIEILPHMFRRDLKGMHLFLALGEAIAHLEHLVGKGRLERIEGDLIRYVAGSG